MVTFRSLSNWDVAPAGCKAKWNTGFMSVLIIPEVNLPPGITIPYNLVCEQPVTSPYASMALNYKIHCFN